MTIKRCIAYIAGCALLLAPAAGAVAAEGIQLGPTLLYPALKASGTYHDNFYQTSDNPRSGWETDVIPSLRITLPVQRFYLNAEGALDFVNYHGIERYIGIEEEDHMNWSAGAAVGADFPGGLSFKIADAFKEEYQTATQEFGPGEWSTNNALTATLGYAIRNALKLEVFGSRTGYTYDSSLDREYDVTLVRGGLYWKFRPEISALFEGSYETYAYDSNTAQDNSATQVSLGLTWDVTAKLTGFAKAGYQWKSYEEIDASLGTEDGEYYTFSAGLRHSFTSRTALQADISRASQESDFPENPYYLETKVAADLSQRFTTKLYGRIGGSYLYDEYPNETSYLNPYDTGGRGVETGTRNDTLLTANVSLGFDVTRWLNLELAYEGEWRDSTFDTFGYEQNQITLSAKAAF